MPKWLKIVLVIIEWVIPGLAKHGKDRVADELDVARRIIKVAFKSATDEAKGLMVEEALRGSPGLDALGKRATKKFNKAKIRLWKKLF